ncbi:FAD-binding protein, partial [candidate division KSB1 bacterium]|nr:FAD-binding protein [candidate division KSB1 bacterium]
MGRSGNRQLQINQPRDDSLRARAEPGVKIGEFIRATQQYGLIAPTGICSDTGISGSTLGGGIGWLMGKHGLAIDN